MKVLCKDRHYRHFELWFNGNCEMWHCKHCSDQIGMSCFPNPEIMKNHTCKARLKDLKASLEGRRVKESELKPCPFCGNNPIILKVGEGGTGEMIECVSENCVNPSVSFYGENIAKDLWNTRTPQ